VNIRPHEDFLRILREHAALCIVRAERIDDPARLARVLVENAMPMVEVALTTPDALSAIEKARQVPGAILGAGTVMTAGQARAAVSAGATFLLTPGLRPEVAEEAAAHDVPVVMGALTPTEVAAAIDLGAAAVKIFPAHLYGPRYLTDLQGPLPDVPLVPSGGIDAHNAPAFLAAGALAVSAGTNVAPPDAVATGDWDEIARRARTFMTALTPPTAAG
jgi:2-dehydro-3-deoxyphosphogluconate aldolase / (4S)-4-hydroxy-2-oxoglutarate aldolase